MRTRRLRCGFSVFFFVRSFNLTERGKFTLNYQKRLESIRCEFPPLLLSVHRRGMAGRFRSSRRTRPLGQRVRSIRFSGSRVRIVSDRFAHKISSSFCIRERSSVGSRMQDIFTPLKRALTITGYHRGSAESRG